MKSNRISESVIRRLPKYYRTLKDLSAHGVERISSGELARKMALNASQIRQDLNCFGGFGQQGYGYHVDILIREIGHILGLDHNYSTIVVGAGGLGRALCRYAGFESEGFLIKAVFDNDEKLIGTKINNFTVISVDGMLPFIRENDIDVVIIATPKSAAQAVCDMLTGTRIKGVWNFAPVDVVAECKVENVHLSDGLYVLSYRLTNEGQY